MTPADRDVAVALAREIAFEAARLLNDAYHHGHKRKEAADRLNVIARAVLALAERPTRDWQPIATAPKDGAWFLAHDPVLGYYAVNWPPTCALGRWAQDLRGKWRGGCVGLFRPTHWQPLPAPPTPSVTCSICRRDDCGGDHPCE